MDGWMISHCCKVTEMDKFHTKKSLQLQSTEEIRRRVSFRDLRLSFK